MQKKKNMIGLVTFIIVVGILFFYVMQMSPSPILLDIKDYYQIGNNDMLLNMCVSITFITTVIGCIIGAKVEQKIGNRNLFILSSILVIIGGLVSLVSFHYYVLLLARAIWGLGFGLSIQFIGSAIMLYYSPTAREQMNTLNGMFPFIGTVISYLFAAPISNALGGVRVSLAIWTVPIIFVLILWMLFVKQSSLSKITTQDDSADDAQEEHIYKNLLSRKPILLLCITFICDYTCYSYVAVIVPTLFYEASDMSQATAGLVAAIAFPAFGMLGSFLGGVYLSKTGLRKPPLLLGQIGKFIGLLIATIGCTTSPALLVGGICIFGVSNGFWMPALYCVPMDLKGMTPTLSGAAFALMTACGLSMGFVAPTVGGALTSVFMNNSGISDAVASHVFGLKWSLMIFACMNIISSVCMFIFKETGTRR